MKITATFYKKGEPYGGYPAEFDCLDITIGTESRTVPLKEIAYRNHDEILIDLPGYRDYVTQVDAAIDEELRARIAPQAVDAFDLVKPYLAAIADAPESHQQSILSEYIASWVESNWDKMIGDLLDAYTESLEDDVKHGDCTENSLRYALREAEIAGEEAP
tara:strand:- start:2392 stop:2874 length:483 start_codon:yes stop_codon:yes gene_type:complete